ncbi:MAG: formimidoylglutamate deiminase [Burkholderiales bacterium]
MSLALFAEHALLPTGWARDVLLEWDAGGSLRTVQPGSQAGSGIERAAGPVLPGMPNLHSHAFQRAFAGLTEYRGAAQDSFWSWRTLMYRFAAAIAPQQLEAIATGLYVEMLEAGYTSVCEFHYLHHDTAGIPYADDTTLSQCLLRAAARAGIGLTLLPVLYQTAGFGGTPAREEQRRFIRSTESMLGLLECLRPLCDAQGARLGLAPHSLRAVPPDSLREVLAGLDAIDATAPIHIHIAEQTGEVDACLAWSGQRPVAWLLDRAPVDRRWCLVHATHMTVDEYRRAAATGAVAGLCPTTEANLGDGIFDVPAWRGAGGRWGVGSDSHACVNAAEELMLLEYSQRLHAHQRNVIAGNEQPFVATAMTLEAVAGGAQASGRPIAGLSPGQRADLVVLDAADPLLAGLASPDAMLGAHVFASHRRSAIQSVWAGGRCAVQDGRHALHDISARDFADARRALALALP